MSRGGDPNPYCQHDELIGHAVVDGQLRALSLRFHINGEHYTRPQELFQLRQDSGTRTFIHAKPYIFAPDTQFTVSLSPQPDLQDSHGAIGTVTEARLRRLRPQDIGHAQAWYYPQDRVIVLWECFLQPHYRDGDDPAMDTLHTAVWRDFEGSQRPIRVGLTRYEALEADGD